MKSLKRIYGIIIFMISICIIGVEVGYADTEVLKAKNLSQFRRIVYDNMLKRQETIIIDYSGSDYKEIFQSFKNEKFLDYIGTIDDITTSNDFDYMVHNISYIKTGMKYGSSSKAEFTINIEWRESIQELQYVNSRIESILDECNISTTDSVYERIKSIHDYIVEHVEYDTSLKDENAYNAIKKGSSTCQGYSLLFYKLLVEAGIKCRYITGTGISAKDTGPHGWNIVNIGDYWYNVDVTWDDPVYLDPRNKSNDISYEYFLKGTKGFDDSHKRDEEFLTSEFMEKHPMAQMDFNKRNDVRVSQMEAFVGTTLEPVVYDEEIEYDPDDVLGKIERFFNNIFDEDVDAAEYLSDSFKELDNKQKTILIILLVLIAVGLISKLFTKKKDYDIYEEDNIKDEE